MVIVRPKGRKGDADQRLERYFQDLEPTLKTTVLTQSDFASGPVIIRASGRYVLGGDIVYEPNADKGMLPAAGTEYGNHFHPFFVGFFAAIIVEADDVVIDLGGRELKTSERFALRQTVYSHIELSNRPFILAEEAGFEHDQIPNISASRVHIKNGTLGRSPHHSVHGSSNDDVLITDVVFQNYEIFPVSLNKVGRLAMLRAEARDTTRNVAMLGEWTSLANMPNSLREAISGYGLSPADKAEAQALVDAVDLVVARTLDPSMFGPRGGPSVLLGVSKYIMDLDPLKRVRGMASKDVDLSFLLSGTGHPTGSVMGGLMINHTLSVGPFATAGDGDAGGSSNIAIDDFTVKGLESRTRESLGIEYLQQKDEDDEDDDDGGGDGEWTMLRGPQGEIYDALTLDDRQRGKRSSLLHDISFWLAERAPEGSAAHVPPEFAAWGAAGTRAGESIFDFVADRADRYRFATHVDFRGHTTKGVAAVRLDGVSDADLRRITVQDARSVAPARDPRIVGADRSGKRYQGGDVRGVSLSRCDGVRCGDELVIEGLSSANGDAIGVHAQGQSEAISIEAVRAKSVHAGAAMTGAAMGREPLACAVLDQGTTDGLDVKRITCRDLVSGYGRTAVVVQEAVDDAVYSMSSWAASDEAAAKRRPLRKKNGAGAQACPSSHHKQQQKQQQKRRKTNFVGCGAQK
jgi:hypothetical protein